MGCQTSYHCCVVCVDSQGSFVESDLSLQLHMGSGDWTQDARLTQQALYPLGRLASCYVKIKQQNMSSRISTTRVFVSLSWKLAVLQCCRPSIAQGLKWPVQATLN